VAILWLLIVTTLLCIPGTELPKFTWQNKIWLDKWIHIFLFMVLVVLWCRVYSRGKNKVGNTSNIYLRIMVIGIAYGVGMEIVQKYFIPFRSFDVGDIIADAVGCITGYLVLRKMFYVR
jgi:VanZ family protein